jgi:hypothetical protein
MSRRRNEVRKGDIFEKMEAQSSSSEKQGHLQKWVKKTEKMLRTKYQYSIEKPQKKYSMP